MAVFILNRMPYSWLIKGIQLESVGYITIDELGKLMHKEGYRTRIDEVTANVIAMLTGELVGQSHGELRRLRSGDYITIFSIPERLLHAFRVVKVPGEEKKEDEE